MPQLEPQHGPLSSPGPQAWGFVKDRAPNGTEGQELRTPIRLTLNESQAGLADSLAGLVHDARNMVAAMNLYCDLLEEPGVLSEACRHYAADLRLVSSSGRHLLDKLAYAAAMNEAQFWMGDGSGTSPAGRTTLPMALPPSLSAEAIGLHGSARPASRQEAALAIPGSSAIAAHSSRLREQQADTLRESKTIASLGANPGANPGANLGEELRANFSLLSAIAGPGIRVEVTACVGEWPLPVSSDDLTRVLVNLVRNAAEAMPGGGRIQVALEVSTDALVLSVADDGPGIPRALLDAIFFPGFSTREPRDRDSEDCPGGASFPATGIANWPVKHRGLGLSIVRSIVSAAGGRVWAANRTGSPKPGEAGSPASSAVMAQGAVIFMEFPLAQDGVAT